MKDLFSSFINPSEDILKSAWHSKNTLFVFDTNVFLNLYGYADQTRKDFFYVANGIRDKIWIPYQVGLEYHRRRLSVIKNEKKVFRDIENILEKIPNEINTELQAYAMWKKDPELDAHLQDLIRNIGKEIEACKGKVSDWNKRQPDVRSMDLILDQIHEITKGKIGPQPENQQWLDDLYKDGELRYEKKIPPGFEDRNKGKGDLEDAIFQHGDLSYQRKFGDLIMWKQLLIKAAEPDISSVIFVTDDAKKDWWNIIDSGGKKIIGPHEGLKSEIYKIKGVEFFHMYTTSEFLEESKGFLNSKIHQSSIEDAYEKNILGIQERTASTITNPLGTVPRVFIDENGNSVYLNFEDYESYKYDMARKHILNKAAHGNKRRTASELLDYYKILTSPEENTDHFDKYSKLINSRKLSEMENQLSSYKERLDKVKMAIAREQFDELDKEIWDGVDDMDRKDWDRDE